MKLMGQMVKKKKGDACIRLRTEEVKPWVNRFEARCSGTWLFWLGVLRA